MTARSLRLIAVCISACALGCTVHQTDIPAPAGPSTTATTLAVNASPDVINLGSGPAVPGGSSNITVQVSRFDGKPVQPGSVHLDVLLPGTGGTSTVLDCGQLSPRDLTFGTDGRTPSAKFTAPSFPLPVSCGSFAPNSSVLIGATLVNSNLQSSSVPVRMMGTLPDVPTPDFYFFPTAATTNESVTFDASASCPGGPGCPPSNSTIVSYQWAFSDGTNDSGQVVHHSFSRPQTFNVTLTVTTDRGASKAVTKTVTVTSGNPTPTITFSPASPKPGDGVMFDASLTQVFGGATIVNYQWLFQGGIPGSSTSGPIAGPVVFPLAGSWLVSLRVTDSLGRQGIVSVQVIAQ
jgi:PKD domain-containing protein